MRLTLALSSAAVVFCLTSAFAQDAKTPSTAEPSTMGTTGQKAPTAESTSTPSVVRPNDADLKDSNRKGGTGGSNSSANGG